MYSSPNSKITLAFGLVQDISFTQFISITKQFVYVVIGQCSFTKAKYCLVMPSCQTRTKTENVALVRLFADILVETQVSVSLNIVSFTKQCFSIEAYILAPI